MAQKRKAQEAFGTPKGQLSAFAAAKLARQSKVPAEVHQADSDTTQDGNALAAEAAIVPYDGQHSRPSTPSEQLPDGDEIISTPVKRSNVAFSTLIANDGNVLVDDSQQLALILQRDETITLLGEYELEVVDSTDVALIAGAVVRETHGRQHVYAPSTHALPSIRALADGTTVRITSVNPKLRKLERLSPLFRNMWAEGASKGRSFALLASSSDDVLQRSLHLQEIDREVEATLHNIIANSNAKSKSRVMAIGAKSSGKSTFNRLLSNFIITSSDPKLLYLDLDPGQPEFGPPSQISLIEVAGPIFGPAFTHPASSNSSGFRLLRSHTIAATQFKEDPEHYKACVEDLLRHADPSLPLVVNTCGWISGLGASVVVDVASQTDVTDVVLIEPVEDTLIESLRRQASDATFHRISRRAPRPTHRTPAETRAMQSMAYFHHRPNTAQNLPGWSSKPISKARPWTVSYAGDDSAISAIMSYGQSPNPEFLAEVLNGSIVAICILDHAIDSPATFLKPLSSSTSKPQSTKAEIVVERTPESLPYIPADSNGFNRRLDPLTSQCIGLGLVRGIEAERQELHLVTPIPESEIVALQNKQVVLVRGSFDAPAWAYLEDLYKDDERAPGYDSGTRPWVSETAMVGIEGSVWRLRHPPVPSSIAPGR